MVTNAQQHLTDELASVRVLQLWRSLQSLRTVISFMSTGAHPDDETSSMLAALGFRDGMSLSYACANRGEGGQNDIGSETTTDLGVLRTAEMERAAQALNMRLYWLSESPDDSIYDFGFSKSGIDTLQQWQHARTLKRFVDIVRMEKPDIVCPTFLDIPGQHGHHRAMTQLAHEVFTAAANPGYQDSSLPPWQIKKLFLPAWSGAGDAYDDDLPPPPATTVVDANGTEPVSGWAWARIGQHSRQYHRTQGMGRWNSMHSNNSWPLHLANSETGAGFAVLKEADKPSLTSGMLNTLSDYAGEVRGHSTGSSYEALADSLEKAHEQCAKAIASWYDDSQVLQHALSAVQHIRSALLLMSKVDDSVSQGLQHRLQRREVELSRVIQLACGGSVSATGNHTFLRPEQSLSIDLEYTGEHAAAELQLPDCWRVSGTAAIAPSTLNRIDVLASDEAALTDPYPSFYDPLRPRSPAVRLTIDIDGVRTSTLHAMSNPPVLIPALTAQLSPGKTVFNVANSMNSQLNDMCSTEISISDILPSNAETAIELPDGWHASVTERGVQVSVGTQHMIDVFDGGSTRTEEKNTLIELPLRLNGQSAFSVKKMNYAHADARARVSPAVVKIRLINAILPEVRIGYIGGGNDRVAHWLKAMGLSVTEVTDAMLQQSDLSVFDTLVVGLFAVRTRPVLLSMMPRVHSWVRDGGHLLTLYHRPWDAWDPESVPPLPLTIGKPSLRWRVTDQNANVEHVQPDHPLLNQPNRIGPEDWKHWHKERGLYFAMQWHDDYSALLSMQDPEEEPHTGALLSAKVGRGRHTHTSLILHHQMEQLVPGAFRLMANLVAPEQSARD